MLMGVEDQRCDSGMYDTDGWLAHRHPVSQFDYKCFIMRRSQESWLSFELPLSLQGMLNRAPELGCG
jgi:hypothetical protein